MNKQAAFDRFLLENPYDYQIVLAKQIQRAPEAPITREEMKYLLNYNLLNPSSARENLKAFATQELGSTLDTLRGQLNKLGLKKEGRSKMDRWVLQEELPAQGSKEIQHPEKEVTASKDSEGEEAHIEVQPGYINYLEHIPDVAVARRSFYLNPFLYSLLADMLKFEGLTTKHAFNQATFEFIVRRKGLAYIERWLEESEKAFPA
jgi:hypothetical protein